MRESDIAWFAGLFEGEGSFEIRKRATVRLCIAMTDRDVIDRVNSLFPGTISVRTSMTPVKSNYNKPRDIYAWRVGKSDEVVRIVTLMLPWLGERRRARAQELLDRVASRPEPGTNGKTHCKNGHELTEGNLMSRAGATPYRRCKTCYRAYQAAAVERRRAARAADQSGQVISA